MGIGHFQHHVASSYDQLGGNHTSASIFWPFWPIYGLTLPLQSPPDQYPAPPAQAHLQPFTSVLL
jgi:hypothetical protein